MRDYLGNDLQRGDQVLFIQNSQGSAWFTKAYVVGPAGKNGMINLEYESSYTKYPHKTYRSPERIIKYEHTPGSSFKLSPEVAPKTKTKKDTDLPQW